MVKKKFTSSKTIKGRTYQYFRKDGRYVRLPDDPNSEEYDREYWRLMRGDGPLSQRYTFEKLILSYKQSPRWETWHRAPEPTILESWNTSLTS